MGVEARTARSSTSSAQTVSASDWLLSLGYATSSDSFGRKLPLSSRRRRMSDGAPATDFRCPAAAKHALWPLAVSADPLCRRPVKLSQVRQCSGLRHRPLLDSIAAPSSGVGSVVQLLPTIRVRARMRGVARNGPPINTGRALAASACGWASASLGQERSLSTSTFVPET